MDSKWWTLIAIALGVFMLLIDVTIVNVALPDIGSDLGSSFSDLEWVVNAYSLTLAASLLVAGSLADLIGRRRVFVGGLAVFTLASLGCGLANDPLLLNLLRGVQGIGGGMMFATSLALIAQAFHGKDRGVAFGVMGAVTGAAVAVGPLVGGVLTDAFGWEWIFFVNLPIGLVAATLTLTRVAESRDPHPAGIDWLGAILFSAALFLLIFGLVRGNAEGWGSATIVASLGGSVLLLALFAVSQLRRDNPLFDLRLLRKPTFLGASMVAFCMSASLFAIFLYLTLYLQGGVLGFSPLEAGLRFLPITGLMLLVGPVAGRLSAIVPVRVLLGGGLFFVGVGLLLMHGVEPGDTWTVLIAGFIVAGLGSGLVNPPLASTAIGVVEPRRSGMASGINSTFRQVGIASGIAALGAVFQHRVHELIAQGTAGMPAAAHADQLAAAVTAGQTERALAAIPAGADPAQVERLREVAHGAFTSGLNTLFVITAIVALVGAVGAALLVRRQDFVVSQAPLAGGAGEGPPVVATAGPEAEPR
ncbi:MFS transporter [Patulibacter defluvii]|uniref:MFS transporter n=1 Tax=Patulibacter defluvii TaxID=3095358 RepID=UPI002A75489A|nr:MFS transporter [Patulibacter sp. DM4]